MREHIDFRPKHVFEIGVGPARTCRSLKHFGRVCRCDIFEPLPRYYKELKDICRSFPLIHVHPVAIWKEDGVVDFVVKSQASFIKGVDSPEEQLGTAGGCRTLQVKAKTIDHFDKGDIDVLLLDMEGAEFHVLERLKSRPKFISVETHYEDKYVNPFMQEIKDWMTTEGYKVIGVGESDTYYAKIQEKVH